VVTAALQEGWPLTRSSEGDTATSAWSGGGVGEEVGRGAAAPIRVEATRRPRSVAQSFQSNSALVGPGLERLGGSSAEILLAGEADVGDKEVGGFRSVGVQVGLAWAHPLAQLLRQQQYIWQTSSEPLPPNALGHPRPSTKVRVPFLPRSPRNFPSAAPWNRPQGAGGGGCCSGSLCAVSQP
jgi:hypothetical protein